MRACEEYFGIFNPGVVTKVQKIMMCKNIIWKKGEQQECFENITFSLRSTVPSQCLCNACAVPVQCLCSACTVLTCSENYCLLCNIFWYLVVLPPSFLCDKAVIEVHYSYSTWLFCLKINTINIMVSKICMTYLSGCLLSIH